jgi:phosphonate transport system ATP-binding protein
MTTGDSRPRAASPSGWLRLEAVGVTYPNGVEALRSTSLEFRRGEICVLLGLSGAGKSTLLRTLNHLVRPTSGRIVSAELGPLEGRGEQLRAHRRRTAVVFQHHQLIERRSALANVLTGRLGYHGLLRSVFPLPRADVELALECLERVGLGEQALTRVEQLSGGQQQRVGIARALAQQPTTLLADEPVASLDPATSQRVLELLRRICEEDGVTAIISLHQLAYARRFADRIIGLAEGAVVFDGSPHELDEAQVAHLFSARPARAATSAQRPSAADSRDRQPEVSMESSP